MLKLSNNNVPARRASLKSATTATSGHDYTFIIIVVTVSAGRLAFFFSCLAPAQAL